MLLPSSAYASKGRMLAYSPTSGGRPASIAYARLCGISITVTIRPAVMSPLSQLRW